MARPKPSFEPTRYGKRLSSNGRPLRIVPEIVQREGKSAMTALVLAPNFCQVAWVVKDKG